MVSPSCKREGQRCFLRKLLNFRNVNFEMLITYKCRISSIWWSLTLLYFALCTRRQIFSFRPWNLFVLQLSTAFSQCRAQRLEGGRRKRYWISFPGLCTQVFLQFSVLRDRMLVVSSAQFSFQFLVPAPFPHHLDLRS